MIRKKLILGLVLGLLGNYMASAQDIHFSQFYESAILRNPSMIGVFNGDYKLGAIYRQQWSSISKPYQTALVNAEVRMPVRGEANDFLSFGVLAYYDKAGSVSLQTTSVYPALTYNKSLGGKNSFLSVGFTGGFIQRSFDPSKATFDNQYQNDRFDPANPTGEVLPDPSFTQWDFGAGFSFNSSAGENNKVSYILGASGYHFTRPKYTFNTDRTISRDIRWNANAGVNVKLNERYSYQLHGNYMLQGKYNETILGGLVTWNKEELSRDESVFSLSGGVFYRFADALIPTLRLRYFTYTFGFSYDVTLSKLTQASNLRGGFEISVSTNGLFRDPLFEKSRTLCPHFY